MYAGTFLLLDSGLIYLLDGRHALQILEEYSEQWNIDPDRLCVLGCSAGGHLSGCLGLLPLDSVSESLAVGSIPAGALPIAARPAAVLLAYPVVSMTAQHTHAASRQNLL